MVPKIDKPEEGLRELASMIAAAYRRRMTGETVEPLISSESNDGNPISEDKIVACIEPADYRSGCVYTETVKVGNFIRNKKRQGNHEKINTRDLIGRPKCHR